jgi:hypothetical protein
MTSIRSNDLFLGWWPACRHRLDAAQEDRQPVLGESIATSSAPTRPSTSKSRGSARQSAEGAVLGQIL